MSDERSPLLPNGEPSARPSFTQRVLAACQKSEGQPGFVKSYRNLIFSSYFNLLLVFIPLAAAAHYAGWDASYRFSFSFIAIMPLAKLIGECTDAMSAELGQTIAGLLNATFGNAIEIIVGIAALLKDERRVVQTSLLGSILSNILLVLGSSFLAGGFKGHQGEFRTRAAQTSASLMTLGCITLVIPAAYRSASLSPKGPLANILSGTEDVESGLLTISRGTAILLLIVYGTYLVFQLKTHHELFIPHSNAHEEDPGEAHANTFAAGSALLLVTVVTSFCADWLVASIEETSERYHIPKAFIGMILIPIVANAAEHTTSIWMALENKYELTMGICVGSSIQVALFVIPLMVLIGWASGHELTLYFSDFETIILFVSVVLVNLLIMDGKSNYMEGVMLITLYLVIALTFWVS